MTESALRSIGDAGFGRIKPALLAADHGGWFLMDGRAAAALPAAAGARAVALGVAVLPNAADRTFRDGNAAAFGTLAGADTVTMTQANMPNYALTGTLDQQTNNHAHTIQNWNNVQGTSGAKAGSGTPGSGGSGAGNLVIQSGGAHAHTFTVGTGGGGQAIDVQDPWLGVNWFIYLGV